MASDAFAPLLAGALGPDGIGLLIAAASALAGAAASVGVKAVIRRGTERGRRRSVASMVLASAAMVPAAASAIAMAGAGSIPAWAAAYAGAGLALGLAAGAFPAAAGAPLVAAAALALSFAAAQAAGTEPWRDGATVVRLVVYSTAGDGTLCRVEAEGGPDRDLSLPPGPISFELRTLSAKGPFRAIVGERRYAIEAVVAGSERVPWPPGRKPAFVPPRALGFSSEASTTGPFTPEDHLSAAVRLGPGPSISLDLR